MNLQPWLPAQDSPEIPVNENFDALSHMAVYAKDATTTVGLTWGYLGGRWGGFLVSSGTVVLPADKTLYLVASRTTGAVSVSDNTDAWDDDARYARIYKLSTGVATVTSIEDYRSGTGGVHGITTTAPSGGGAAPIVPVVATSYAITPTDVGCYIRFTAPGEKTATLDVISSFAQDQEYHLTNRATDGDITLYGVGVTLNVPKGGTLILEPKDTVTVKFISNAEADVLGSTKGAS